MRQRLILVSGKLNSTLKMRFRTEIFKERISLESGEKEQLLKSEGGSPKNSNKKSLFCCSIMTPILVWIAIFGVFSTALLRSAIPIYLNVADEKFLEIKKCPACFGVQVCPAFLTGEIVPETWSRYKATQLLNKRNVYFATFKDKHVSYMINIVIAKFVPIPFLQNLIENPMITSYYLQLRKAFDILLTCRLC